MYHLLSIYEKVIAETPTEWKGVPLKEKSARAVCVDKLKNRKTNRMMTMYYMDGRYFVVENGKIL